MVKYFEILIASILGIVGSVTGLTSQSIIGQQQTLHYTVKVRNKKELFFVSAFVGLKRKRGKRIFLTVDKFLVGL